MTQDQIVLGDDDIDDDEEAARVSLVMRDTPGVVPENNVGPEIVEPVKPTKGIVWAEARVAAPTDHPQELPTEIVAISQVKVIPVEIDNETFTPPTTTTPTDSLPSEECANYAQRERSYSQVESDEEDDMVTLPPAPTTCSLYRWNFIVCAFGNSLLVAAASTTLAFEVAASVIYTTGALFHWIAEVFARAGKWTLLFQSIFRFISVLILSIDLILLTISTLLVELLSWIAGIICILFGGITVGVGMHQHIRQVCQLIRSLFRRFHNGWSPPRMEPYVFQEEEVERNDNEEHEPLPT